MICLSETYWKEWFRKHYLFENIRKRIYEKSSKVTLVTFSREGPEGFLFKSYYTDVYGWALLLSLDCSTLPLILTVYYWVLRKDASSNIFRVFSMTRLVIEPQSAGPLANTLIIRPMVRRSFAIIKLFDIKYLIFTSTFRKPCSLYVHFYRRYLKTDATH